MGWCGWGGVQGRRINANLVFFFVLTMTHNDDQELPTIIIRIVEKPTVVTLDNRRTYFHFREVQVLR